MKKVLLLTDNGLLYSRFIELLDSCFPEYWALFDFRKSYQSRIVKNYEHGLEELKELDIKSNIVELIDKYSLIISLHCKQVFPEEVVRKIRCINVHPGYNPINRGWYPQVFAILNNLPVGATIHEMDEQIDNGAIICRGIVPIYSYDTSKDVYERVMDKEMALLEQHFIDIIEGNYQVTIPNELGHFHTRKDFLELCRLDLSEHTTFRDAINRLRALTHGDYSNAYFIDELGHKVYVKIALENVT
jgi:methionyl-tRNA formyltransferase